MVKRPPQSGLILALAALQLALALGCRGGGNQAPQHDGLLLALSSFDHGPEGPRPRPARFDVLVRAGKGWRLSSVEDADSNVFHKAMACDLGDGLKGILTAGGTKAVLKLWRRGGEPTRVWQADFGGSFSRMRDVEVADVDGDGKQELVVATHDQGVVALVRPTSGAAFSVEELDREPGVFVHEVEVGDLDGDGVPEVYATPSRPNRMDGTPQPGSVVCYVPAQKAGRRLVADLGARHAKEILVTDVDGDGRDELYAAVEAVSGGSVEIRRYAAGTPPSAGLTVATLPDSMCRCLVAGDVDGDRRKELIAAAHKSGLWLLRPSADPQGEWSRTRIDERSSGIEHASLLADLDGDGRAELYVANDGGREVNRYTWRSGSPLKETLFRYPAEQDYITWNIMPVPVDLAP
jgi:hypothetical protein